jgi:hypothetical protein
MHPVLGTPWTSFSGMWMDWSCTWHMYSANRISMDTRPCRYRWQWGGRCHDEGHTIFKASWYLVSSVWTFHLWILVKRQQDWDHTQGNKLWDVKPVLLPWRSSCHSVCLAKVMLACLRVVHTRLTPQPSSFHDPAPPCVFPVMCNSVSDTSC